jgi:methionyl-tRNA synthetase
LNGILPAAGEAPQDKELLAQVATGCKTLAGEFDRYAFSTGLDAWMGAVFACNAYIDAEAPWKLKKEDPARMAEVLGTLVAAIRPLAEAVSSVIPEAAAKIVALIDSGNDGAPIEQPTPLFPRLELEAEAAA